MQLTNLMWLVLIGSHHPSHGHLDPELYLALKIHMRFGLSPPVIKHTLSELYHVTKTNAD